MVRYKRLPPDLYRMIKRSLAEDYILSQYPPYHDAMLDSFELVSVDGSVPVFYYKDGTLEIPGEESSRMFRRVVRRVNGLVSKKDYI